MDEDPVLQVESHRPGEHDALEVFPLHLHVADGVAVADLDDVLGDDGAVIEGLRHVVAGGADDLDAPVIGLLVGASPCESRQEGVMDVDDPVRPVCHETIREDLHVTGKDDAIDSVALEPASSISSCCTLSSGVMGT